MFQNCICYYGIWKWKQSCNQINTSTFGKENQYYYIYSADKETSREMNILETVSARIWTLNQFSLPLSLPYYICLRWGTSRTTQMSVQRRSLYVQTNTDGTVIFLIQTYGSENERLWHNRDVGGFDVCSGKPDITWENKTQKKVAL